jgi:hypothetical protein
VADPFGFKGSGFCFFSPSHESKPAPFEGRKGCGTQGKKSQLRGRANSFDFIEKIDGGKRDDAPESLLKTKAVSPFLLGLAAFFLRCRWPALFRSTTSPLRNL